MSTARALDVASPEAGVQRRPLWSARVSVLTPTWAAVALALVGLALRLYHLGTRPLWLDETYTAHAVRFGTLGDVIAWTYTSLDQMPIFNVLTWLLRGLGATEWALRLPSALAGSAGVFAIYVLGRALARPRVGLVAALVTALLPFMVWYGQEARAYALFMLLATAQMLYAYRAVRRGRAGDWLGLAVASALALYTHYLSLFTTAVVCAYVGLALLVEAVGVAWAPREGRRERARRLAGQAGGAALAGGLTALAYVPWLPALRDFLRRDGGDRGFGQFSAAYHATLADVRALLASFGLTDLLAALLCAGIVVSLVAVVRGRRREGGLVLLWLAVPTLAYWLRIHGGIVTVSPRYFSPLVPVAILLVALGVEGVAQAAGFVVRLVARWRAGPATGYPPCGCAWQQTGTAVPGYFSRGLLGRWQDIGARAASAVVALLVVAQLSPQLALQYTRPKTDYRGAAARIIASSPPGSVALALGSCNDFILGSLEYYAWRAHAPVVVVDGAQLDDRVVDRLRLGTGRVWAAVITGSGDSGCSLPTDLSRVSTAGLDVARFAEIAVLRPDAAHLSPLAQARVLLRWGLALQPQAQSSLDLLNTLASHAHLGSNLLPAPALSGAAAAPERWQLAPGTAVSADRSAFELSPTGAMVNVVLVTRRVAPGRTYVLSFDYRNAALSGEQKVYVSALGPTGRWLSIFPNGAGYSCSVAASWTRGTFAFTPPAGVTSLIVWLRATGSGSAGFRAVALRPVE